MGGIINYYHGESGVVVDDRYIFTEQKNVRVLRMQDNPHREFAYDYEGGDVHVDPSLKVGDRAVFIRTDLYGGIWVREQDQFYPRLQQALDRVRDEIMSRPRSPGSITVRLQDVWTEQYISEETQSKAGSPVFERPATDASFFLSFSSENVMLARQIFEDLKYDAKVKVWLDLDQIRDAPEHRRRLERWLREAVHQHRGFILLWTEAASRSSWVRREISWALQKASHERSFRFIVLKLDEEPLAPEIRNTPYLIDCYDLWPVHGINEELFAAVIQRQGRNAWIKQHRQRGAVLLEEDESFGYTPFRSDSGVAISLQSWEENGEFCWQLNYEKHRRLHKVFGRGEAQAVDLGIRTGDYVASLVCHRAPLCRFWPGATLWMRSDDLGIKPEDVLVTYWENSDNGRNDKLSFNKALTRARRRTQR